MHIGEPDSEGTLAMSNLRVIYQVHSLNNQMIASAGIALFTLVLDALTYSG